MLYIGIIDVLQSYRLAKKLEHAVKSLVHDGVRVPIPVFFCASNSDLLTQICSDSAAACSIVADGKMLPNMNLLFENCSNSFPFCINGSKS